MAIDSNTVRAKLARSQEHAQTINDEIISWIKRSPYHIVNTHQPDGSRYSIVLRITEPPPLLRWSLIAGDCINNMRSALDHLIYCIARESPNFSSDEDTLAFPITDKGENFDNAVLRGKLKGIDGKVIAVIKSFQPYNRPHPELPPLLRVLRELNNADKHRLVPVIFAGLNSGQIGWRGEGLTVPPDCRVIPNTGNLEDGTEIVALTCEPPTPNMKLQAGEISLAISIRHGKRDPSAPDDRDRSDVTVVLPFLLGEVRTIVFEILAGL